MGMYIRFFSFVNSLTPQRDMSDAEYDQDDDKPLNLKSNRGDGKLKGNRITPLSDEEVAKLDEEADTMNTAL